MHSKSNVASFEKTLEPNESTILDTTEVNTVVDTKDSANACTLQHIQDIQIDIEDVPKSRVAFLSSKSRTYFPQDTGVSRFGIYYSMNSAPGDVPNPNYFPFDDRPGKPISNKGYGIGGLLGPRFGKEYFANNPAPNAYQQSLVPAINRKKSSKKLKSVMTMKSSIYEGEEDEMRVKREWEMNKYLRRSTSQNPAPILIHKEKERTRQLCFQSFIGFGSNLSVSRFGSGPTFNNVGVGYYNLNGINAQLRKSCSFGQKPVKLFQNTSTRCNYQGYDNCFECDEELKITDYYRTLTKIKNPFHSSNRNEKLVGMDADSIYFREGSTSSASKNLKKVFVSLCRRCYCLAMRGESRFWSPAEIPQLFHKTRHCQFIHDHQNIPIFTHKTNCKLIRKLSKKEILMGKYYKDSCPRVFK